MSFAKIFSAQTYLLKPHLISVEIDLTRGLHSFSIVGLPDKAIEESRDRVSSAIKNSGFKSPKQTNIKIVVSLAPADIRKEGPAFDLPIAIGYLAAVGEFKTGTDHWSKKLFVGELALDGTVRPINGALLFVRMAIKNGFTEIFIPIDNLREVSSINNIKIFGVKNLKQMILHLQGKEFIKEAAAIQSKITTKDESIQNIILDDIVGHENAKRALIIAATGKHNICLFGPPGSGKTMLAKAFQSIAPHLSTEESLEVTEIYSATGNLFLDERPLITKPPFRSPHHTSSYASIIGGGGKIPKPGEITLAHHGILFMDEFPEFDRKVLESLRQPLEEKHISISRVNGCEKFPADFMLVAAMNPCPCGKRGIKGKTCTCSASDIAHYKRKLSGPIIDRIDLWVEVSKIDYKKLTSNKIGSTETDRARLTVSEARIKLIKFKYMTLSLDAKQTLEKGAEKHDLSGRGFHRVIKLARTIASIDNSEIIKSQHILEALQYRQRN